MVLRNGHSGFFFKLPDPKFYFPLKASESAIPRQILGDASNPVVISARGQAIQKATTDIALASLTVGTTVEFANIFAGYDADLNPVNGDAQIGTIKVLNKLKTPIAWTASNVVAGASNPNPNEFATANDVRIVSDDNPNIVSRIASLVISGNLAGTAASGDHFGFVAQQFGTLTLGTTTVALHTSTTPDVVDPLGSTNDTSLREIAI